MARSRNFGRSNCERKKSIRKKEIKTKHRKPSYDVRTGLVEAGPVEALTLMVEQEVTKHDVKTYWQKELYKAFYMIKKTGSKYKRSFFRNTVKLLNDIGFDMTQSAAIIIVRNIALHSEEIIRPVHRWTAKVLNYDRSPQLLIDLAHHCFGIYDVPPFLKNVWGYETRHLAREWYVQVSRGVSLRELERTPIQVTKKVARALQEAPELSQINASFRWAEIKALGASTELTDALMRTNLGSAWRRFDNYWKSVVKWCVVRNAGPMQVGQIIDWLSYYKNQEEPISLKKRTLVSVMRAVEEWHVQFRYVRNWNYEKLKWDGCAVADWSFAQEDESSIKMFNVVQLCSSDELQQESLRMHHCVATYAQRAHRGDCAIFSLRSEENGVPAPRPLATIELWPKSRKVVQVRSLQNQRPDHESMQIVNKWAALHGFSVR